MFLFFFPSSTHSTYIPCPPAASFWSYEYIRVLCVTSEMLSPTLIEDTKIPTLSYFPTLHFLHIQFHKQDTYTLLTHTRTHSTTLVHFLYHIHTLQYLDTLLHLLTYYQPLLHLNTSHGNHFLHQPQPALPGTLARSIQNTHYNIFQLLSHKEGA